MPLSPGTKVGESYELLRPLDQGNMGELWVAKQGTLREVAIKFMLGSRTDLRTRFEGEIRVVAQLRSTYVVHVLDWGMFEEAPFMVMDLLSGTNLEVLVRRSGPMPVATAVDYIVQAAAGLAEAHRLGIVHRDLKPANLFFDDATQAIKVLDWARPTTALPNNSMTRRAPLRPSTFGH